MKTGLIGISDRRWKWTRKSAPVVSREGDSVSWACDGGTDYWRLTSSGSVAHSGHACLVSLDGDFALEAEFAGELAARYDQIGFIVIRSPMEWFKGGFEFDGGVHVGGVFTRETSDWSLGRAVLPAGLRLTRSSGTLELSWRAHGSEWLLVRQLTLQGPVEAGFYSAAPTGPGFRATIKGLRFEAKG